MNSRSSRLHSHSDPLRPPKTSAGQDPGVTRRLFLRGGAAAIGGLASGIWPSYRARAQATSMTVTAGYIPIVDSTPIPIAYEKGFFREMGLKAERPKLIRGWAPLLEAFVSKQILLTHVLLFQMLFMRFEQKIPVRSVAFNHLNGVAMLGGPGIRSFGDLGGKIVGCPTWWAPHTLLFQKCLVAAGLKPVVRRPGQAIAPSEVAFRVLPPPDMPNALATGAISGAVVSEAFGAAAELLARSTLLRMSGDVWHEHPCCQSVLLQPTIDRDPSWARAVTTAIARACAWCEDNREEMVDILSKEGGGYFPMPRKVVERGVNFVDLEEYGVDTGTGAIRHPDWNVKRLGFNPYPYPSAFELAVRLMKETVVDDSVALTPRMRNMDPASTARETVAYPLVRAAIEQAGGTEQFVAPVSEDPWNRRERFSV